MLYVKIVNVKMNRMAASNHWYQKSVFFFFSLSILSWTQNVWHVWGALFFSFALLCFHHCHAKYVQLYTIKVHCQHKQTQRKKGARNQLVQFEWLKFSCRLCATYQIYFTCCHRLFAFVVVAVVFLIPSVCHRLSLNKWHWHCFHVFFFLSVCHVACCEHCCNSCRVTHIRWKWSTIRPIRILLSSWKCIPKVQVYIVYVKNLSIYYGIIAQLLRGKEVIVIR